MITTDSTSSTIGLVTPKVPSPKIGPRKKSFTPGATNSSPEASKRAQLCSFRFSRPAHHSAGGIVTIWT